MFALKTGALIRASVMSVSLLADPVPPGYSAALDGFGRAIGLAFQIRDDLLDVEGKTEDIGKTAGSDYWRRALAVSTCCPKRRH